MAENPTRAAADARFERVLEETGARDPRDFYRQRLRELRERDPETFRRAVAYHDTRLVPAVAAEGSDALAEWLEYGRVLASLVAEGRTVQIDPSGRAFPYARPIPPDHLVLHLPDNPAGPALLVGIPPRLSPAQRATHDLLVRGSRE
ncbi:MAG: hypothetical protein M3409_02015 [Gemmatimonadota bacterium]|nr:hypothetical protein [Gemmatimonadota bacterium]